MISNLMKWNVSGLLPRIRNRSPQKTISNGLMAAQGNRGGVIRLCARYGIIVTAFPLFALAMEPLDDESMANVAGQGGMSISGDVFINEEGGPISNATFGDCTDNRRCGARLASQFSEDGGWWVLDDFRGRFQFDGLTLRVRHIDSGFGGDGADFDRSVLEIGLPGTVSMEEVRYTLGTSTTARPTDPGFQQTNFYSIQMEGDMRLEGNVLVFPTGNP